MALLQRLPLIVSILVGLLMLAALGWQGRAIYSEIKTQPDIGHAALVSPASTNAKPPEIAFSKLFLFGQDTVAAPTPNQTENLPETNLSIFLRGVAAGDGKAFASALVEGPDKKTDSYHVGDELPGNAKLHEIFSNRIVLNRNNQLENLYFPESRDADDTGSLELSGGYLDAYAQPVEDTAASYEAPVDVAEAPANVVDTPVNGISEERKAEIKQRLQQLRERLKANYGQ